VLRLLRLAALGGVLAAAQPQYAGQYEGRTIASVVYSPLPQPLDPRDLEKIQVFTAGAAFREADAAVTIDRLFATGYYDDIQIDVAPQGDQVVVRVITKNAWFTGHISIQGSVKDPPNRPELEDATQLRLGRPFDPEDLSGAEQNLHRLLEANGFYNHTLRLETTDDAPSLERDVKVIVNLGPRARYEAPAIKGETELSDDSVIRATGWRIRFIGRWRQVTQARTRGGVTGVLKKYQKDDRLTSQVSLGTPEYDAETHRVKENLDITPGPKVDVKTLETKVSKRTLKKYVPVFQEQRVNRDLLVQGARNLRDYFQSQGYFEVDVDFRQRQEDPDHEVVEYIISRGLRYKLVKVDIQGNQFFNTDDIRERMFLQPGGFIHLRHGRYSEAFVRRDEESIMNLYKANGFRDVTVTSQVQRNYQSKPDQLAVVIRIEEGKIWSIAKLEFAGFNDVPADSLKNQLASTVGQAFSEANVAADRNTIIRAYQEAGFPNAQFQWSFVPTGDANQVELHYQVAEGPRQFVRRVITSGIQTTSPKIVDSRITIAEDDPLSLVKMSSVERNLYQLGIFSRIDMAIQNPDGGVEYKNVLYDFTESSRYTLALGVGAEVARFGGTTTDLTQAAGAVGFSPRFSVQASRLNLLGLGHTVTLRGRISNLEQLASIEYLAPRLQGVEGRNITLTTLYDATRDVTTFSSKREEASVQLSHKLSKPSNLLLRLAYRRVTTSDVVIPSLLIPQLLQPVRIGMLSANYVQDRRDNPADGHRGIYNSVDVGVASNLLGSQRSFVRVLGRNATYHQLTRSVVLARQTSFGVIAPFHKPAGLSSADAIPLPERFFGGGTVTLRAFPENQAGPRDIGAPTTPGGPSSPPTGFPLGGNALLFNNIELRFPLLGDNVEGVLFHDAGNIYTNVSSISFRAKQRSLTDFNYMVHAVGFGVRYRTPVGPVRLDLAYSINPPSFMGFQGTVQQLVLCGNGVSVTCKPVQQSISHFQFFFSIGQTF
jgi:outer membrane protein assembly complex protein YaeT